MSGSPSFLFDFGFYGPVAPGAVAINLGQYSPALGYGWTAPIGYGSEGAGPDPLLSGFDGGTDASFRVDVPDGAYAVTAHLGDYGGFSSDHVWYQGASVASGSTSPGRFFEPTFPVVVSGGQMTLNFTNDGNYYPFKLNGLQITPVTSLVAAIAGAPTTSPAGTPITLTGSVTGSSSSTPGLVAYAWSVTKDGAAFATGAGSSFSFTPDDMGSYAVSLVATGKDGSSGVPAKATVAATDVAPTARAGGPYQVTSGLPLKFSGSATDPAAAVVAAGFTYTWNFGDGTAGSGANPSHIYATPGTYNVGLTVADKNGGTGTSVAAVTVSAAESSSVDGSLLFDFGFYGPVAPGAVAINLGQYSPALGYGWTAPIGYGSEGAGPDPLLSGFDGGTDASFRVDVPDGVYAVTAHLGDYGGSSNDHIYYQGASVASGSTSPGRFFEPTFPVVVSGGQMTLNFTNDGGPSPFKLAGLRIQAPISASAGPDQSVKQGDGVDFSGRAFPGIGASYVWDFGDGTEVAGTLSPRHVYEDGGVYTARLTVTDGFGDTTSSTAKVSVAYVAPTATISGAPTTSLPAGASISLVGSATDPSTTVSAAGYAYSWAVLRGGVAVASGTGPSIAFTAGTEGTYTASLMATDKDGLSGTAGVTITVVNPTHLPTIRTPNDTIPNFVSRPTIVSVADGSWSNPATWSLGRVPTDGDVVEVATGTTVNYDVTSTARLQAVGVDPQATLEFRTDINTKMYVTDMVIFYGGTLEIGTTTSPVASDVIAKILFNNVPIDTTIDPSQYGNGLIALGRVNIHGAVKTPSFQPLASEAHAGDATLQLSRSEAGWRPGDKLYLPDSGQMDYDPYKGYGIYSLQSETVIVAGISPDGRTITLATPLAYDHLGGRDSRGNLVYLPDVVEMTRNVVLASESGVETRGHAIFTGRADVDIEDASFIGLGRTTVEAADSTTYDAGGHVTHVGTNQEDRNAVQFRDLVGPTAPQPDGYQYTFVDNVITCPIMDNDEIWPININNSSYGLIRGNAVVNWAGAGIITETGSEVHNMISGNFVSGIRGTGDRYAFGREGAGYWFRGPDNDVVNNVATDISGGVYSYGFVSDFAYYLGTVPVPAYQGADPSVPGRSILVNMNDTPLLDFSGNRVYGKTPNGLTYWWLGTVADVPYADAKPSVIEGFQAWNIYQWGIFGYQSNGLKIDNFSDLGSKDVTAGGWGGTGIWFSDYYSKDLKITNANIQDLQVGISAPVNTAGTVTIDDSYFSDRTDITVPDLFTVSYTSMNLGPRLLVISNDQFDDSSALSWDQSSNYIDMLYGGNNEAQTDTVLVYNFDRVAGDNFQVYYAQQAPDFVMSITTYNPDGTPSYIGAPVAGLTNAEAWAKYGIATGGKVAIGTAARRGIGGLVGSIS